MYLWARKFCVAMLALAVLAAPCLSTIDLFRAGLAHAHQASHAHHSPDAGTADQNHHSAHGHEHGQATVVFTSDRQPGPDRELASCCRLCDGWLTKRTADDRQAIQQSAPAPDRESGKNIVAVPVIALGVRLPDRLCTYPDVSDLAESASLPVYALTQRFRI